MKRLVLGGALLFLAGCAGAPLTSLEHGRGEAIVFARLQSLYNGEDRTPQSALVFKKVQEDAASKNTYFYGPGGAGPGSYTTVRPGPRGLIVAKLPLGEYQLFKVICRPEQDSEELIYTFQDSPPSFILNDPAPLYYLGDLHTDWQGPVALKWDWTLEQGLRKLAMDKVVQDGTLRLQGTDRLEETAADLRQRFPEAANFQKNLLQWPGPEPEEIAAPDAVPAAPETGE